MAEVNNENKLISQYISYLKEVSRKIGTRSDFEKVYLKTTKRNNTHTSQVRIDIYDYFNLELFDKLKAIFNLLESNPDFRLFYGFGLICGKQGKYASPLIFAECDLELKREDGKEYFTHNIKTENIYINYDLISSIMESSYAQFAEDDEEINISFEKEGEIVDKIELRIDNSFKSEEDLTDLSKEIFNTLHKELDEFKNISIIDADNYDYKREINLYLTDKKNSIFSSKNLCYVNANHIFVSRLPSQISTYEALNTLLAEVKANSFRNEVLAKLLMSAFSKRDSLKIKFDSEKEREIDRFIEDKTPIPLSNMQKKALKNALLSEISYIQGPPGTGKSHTISALALISICLNKRILVVSQKPPAVKVVREKVEEFLNVFPGITSVIYFDKDFKKKLRESTKLILDITDNKYKLEKEVQELKREVEKINNKLDEINNEIHETKEELKKNLDIQFEYSKVNEELVKFIEYFSSIYHNLSKDQNCSIGISGDLIQRIGDKLQKIKETEKNFQDNRVSIIYKFNTLRCASKKLIGVEYDYLLKVFKERNISHYLDDLIKLNEKYKDLKIIRRKIRDNNDQLNKKLDSLLKEREKLQNQFVKLSYKHKVYSLLLLPDKYENLEKFVKMLGHKKAPVIKSYMGKINWDSLLSVFPVWISEIRNIGEILPMKPNMFDIVIVDEASQVNLAEIFPIFYRGKNICIVGDHKQLSLISTGLSFQLSTKLDALIWEKYKPGNMHYRDGITRNLTVTRASILDFVRSEYNNFNIREVMLDEHFRSLPALAKFTNEKFYEDKLKIMTETPDKVFVKTFYPIRVVNGKRDNDKIIQEEINAVVDLLNFLIKGERKEYLSNVALNCFLNCSYSIGVISPIRNHIEAIKERIDFEFNADLIDKYSLIAGTPEELQGHERDIMIISLCLDEDCFKSSNHYQNKNRLNVATSRAKYFTFIVYSAIPNNFNLILSYVKHFNFEPDVAKPVIIEEVENPLGWKFNPQNYESEFERIVFHYLNKYIESRSSVSELKIYNQVKTCGQKRLDFVVYNLINKKFAALEVDGQFHFSDTGKEYSAEHLERIEILRRAGWKIINTPYYCWYKDGWLCDENSQTLKKELNRIYSELDESLGIVS